MSLTHTYIRRRSSATNGSGRSFILATGEKTSLLSTDKHQNKPVFASTLTIKRRPLNVNTDYLKMGWLNRIDRYKKNIAESGGRMDSGYETRNKKRNSKCVPFFLLTLLFLILLCFLVMHSKHEATSLYISCEETEH